MHAYMHRYIRRDKEMARQKKDIDTARSNLVRKGHTPKQALKKIKKAFMSAIKQK